MKRMNNFLTLVFAALAFTAFTACTDDKNGPEDGDGVGLPKGEAWMSIRIQTANEGRALHDPKEENGTANETKVTTARALFFKDGTNPTDPKVLVDDISLTTEQLGLPGQSTGLGGKAFGVSKEAQYLLIVTNPSSKFGTFTKGTTYTAVNKAIESATVADVIGASKNNFMMTNAKGGLEPSTANGTLAELTLHITAADAESAPQAIHVDRVAAKVRLYTASGINDNANALIGDIGWVLNVTNKKFFPVSERTFTWNEGATAKTVATDGYDYTPTTGGTWFAGASSDAGTYPLNTCRAPFDKYKLGSYRIDPNYKDNDVDNAATYAANYAVYSTTTRPANTDWLADKGVAYCLENTQIKAQNQEAYTTQVLLRAQYAPKGLKNQDGTNVAPALKAGDSWIKIGANGYYTLASLATYIKAELTLKFPPEKLSEDPATILTPLTDAFNTYLASLGKSITIPATWAAFKTELNIAGDLDKTKVENGIVALVKKFTDLDIDDFKASTVGSVSFFEGGWNYYPIMIKHDDVDALTAVDGPQGALNELGEFGVVRNSVYDITVNKIMNVGFPDIPKPGKDDDEKDNLLISVQININPWTWYTQSIDL